MTRARFIIVLNICVLSWHGTYAMEEIKEDAWSFEESFNIDEDDIFGYKQYPLISDDNKKPDIKILPRLPEPSTQVKKETIDQQDTIACAFKDQGCEALLSKSRKIIHEEYYCFHNKNRKSYWCNACKSPIVVKMINKHLNTQQHQNYVEQIKTQTPHINLDKLFEETTLEDERIKEYLVINQICSYMVTKQQAAAHKKERDYHLCEICYIYTLNQYRHEKTLKHKNALALLQSQQNPVEKQLFVWKLNHE